MIQRIQSVYLLLVAVAATLGAFVFPLWTFPNGTAAFAADTLWILLVFLAVVVLALAAIFMFKNRKNQFIMNRLNLVLNLFLLGFFVYRSLSLSGGADAPEKGIGMLIPVFSIVFLVLANRAIKKDEDLVKSVDRLRWT